MSCNEAELIFAPVAPDGCSGGVGVGVVGGVGGGGGEEVGPGEPAVVGDFVWVGVEVGGEAADEDGAEFVFDDAVVGWGGVAVGGDDVDDVCGCGTEFVAQAAGNGGFEGFVGQGVAAAGTGPDVGPDFFDGCALGGEELAGVIEEEDGEGEVDFGVGMMRFEFGTRFASGLARFGGEDDELVTRLHFRFSFGIMELDIFGYTDCSRGRCMADIYLKLDDARAILLADIPKIIDERIDDRMEVRLIAERSYTRQMMEEVANGIKDELKVEIRKVRGMLEEDATAEGRRLTRVDKRSAKTQSLLHKHLSDHAGLL